MVEKQLQKRNVEKNRLNRQSEVSCIRIRLTGQCDVHKHRPAHWCPILHKFDGSLSNSNEARPSTQLARCLGKLFEHLACGKPIVSTPIPEVVSIRQDAVAFYNNVSSLVNTLVDILSDKNIRTSLKKGLSTSQEIMIGD